jgi:hypothetical protein
MPWNEVAPGRYERPLDGIENTCRLMRDLFAPFNGPHNWEMNFVLKLRFGDELCEDDILTGLRSAWAQLRYNHPLIAGLLRDTNYVYSIPKSRDKVEEWLSKSFLVHRNNNVEDWFRSVGVLDFSSLHFFPASSELVMRLHHWQEDGIGALHLLDNYLRHFFESDNTHPKFGDEASRLAPSQAETGPLAASSDPRIVKAAEKLFSQHPALVPSVGLEIKTGPPAGCASARISIPGPSFEEIKAASKKAGLGLAAAIHAAIIETTYDMASTETADRDFTSMNFFNYRRYVKPEYANPKKWATGCWMVATPFTLPRADFATNARALQLKYHQPLSIDQWVEAEHYGTYTAIFANLLNQPLPEGVVPPPQTCPQLSSLGRMDDVVQHEYEGRRLVAVDHIELDMNLMAPGYMVYQWSWKGNLFLSASSTRGSTTGITLNSFWIMSGYIYSRD